MKFVDDAKERVREISVQQVMQKLSRNEKFHLVDVREESEWAAGRAQNAAHLSKGVIERDVEKSIPDFNAEIVLYCGGGFRSALAADNLKKMGYKNVFSMAGGWSAWLESGAPVQK